MRLSRIKVHRLKASNISRSPSCFRRSLNQDALGILQLQQPPPIPDQEHGDIRARLQAWNSEYGRNITNLIQNQELLFQRSNQLTPQADDGSVDAKVAGFEATSDVRKGDLVELSFKLGVVLHIRGSDVWALDARGNLCHAPSRLIKWAVPDFVEPASLEQLAKYALVHFSQEMDIHVPAELASPVTQALAKFEAQVVDVYRNHSIVLDDCHNLLADEEDLRHGSLEKIAQKLLNSGQRQVTNAEAYAIRQALERQGSAFVLDALQPRTSQIYTIIPKALIAQFATLQAWIRGYRKALSSVPINTSSPTYTNVDKFIKQTTSLIKQYRSRHMTGNLLSPEFELSNDRYEISESMDGVNFSKSHQHLIRFIEFWALQRALPNGPLSTLAIFLIRATGMYDDIDELTLAHGRLFLKEIGVIPFWFNHHLVNPTAMIPCAEYSKSLQLYYQKVHAEPCLLEDSMAKYRQPPYEPTVYCIDPPGSSEVDDGISLSEIPHEPNNYWIGIHVANPSAFLSPSGGNTSDVYNLARQLVETAYCNETHFPMLPKYVTTQCNIASGSPCLTFHAKIDSEGNILDKKITSDVLQNVKYVEYSQVDQALGNATASSFNWIEIGSKRWHKPEATSLEPRDIANLCLLQKLALSRQRLSGRLGALRWPSQALQAQVRTHERIMDGSDVSKLFPHRRRPQIYFGPPQIRITSLLPFDEATSLSIVAPSDFRATSMVATFMALGGSIAADWAWERRVPLLYRATLPKVDIPQIQRYRAENLDRLGQPVDNFSNDNVIEWLKNGSNTITTRPAVCLSPAIARYAKVTSPLRRYADLINHLQIESVLRYEADSGISTIIVPTNYDSSENQILSSRESALSELCPVPALASQLAFSQSQLEAEISRIRSRERTLRAVSRASNRHWLMQGLFRALHGGQSGEDQYRVYNSSAGVSHDEELWSRSLPESGTCVLRTLEPRSTVQTVALDYFGGTMVAQGDFGVPVVLNQGGLRVLDVWEMRLVRVDVHTPTAIFEPVRLIHRADEEVQRRFEGDLLNVMNEPVKLPLWT